MKTALVIESVAIVRYNLVTALEDVFHETGEMFPIVVGTCYKDATMKITETENFVASVPLDIRTVRGKASSKKQWNGLELVDKIWGKDFKINVVVYSPTKSYSEAKRCLPTKINQENYFNGEEMMYAWAKRVVYLLKQK